METQQTRHYVADHYDLYITCDYSATQQESRFLPLYGFCSVLWLILHVFRFDLIPS